ncbi:MAG TPA: N-acetyltransferase [Candidatus Acidoferrum sp.]|nr:N-acetyltransferase [Candidatus Acidoferrum sp.]
MTPSQGTRRKNSKELSSGAAVEFRLRSFEPDDFETLWRIDQACYEPQVAYSRRELKNYLSFWGADCVVAEARERDSIPRAAIAGFCITARRSELGYVITMDVLSDWRRHGVGTLLVKEAEGRMASNGVREVSLETATDNEAGIAFWKRHGYRNRGVRKGYYPGGRDAFAMFKILPRRD